MADTVVCQDVASYGPALLTGGAVILSAGLAALGVSRTIKNQRRIARKRAALDVLLKSEEERHYETMREVFIALRDGDGLQSVLDSKAKKKVSDRRTLQAFLNHHELISISMIQGIIDWKIYNKWMGPSFVADWNDSRELIAILRQRHRKSMFSNFELVATRWG